MERYKWPSKGRRLERAEFEALHKPKSPDTHDTSRLVKTAPRKLRRKIQGKKFRPIYYHGIPTKESHKAIVHAMRVIDRRGSFEWNRQVNIGLACVLWGTALKLVEHRQSLAAMKIRHDTMKANGTWIERNVNFGY